MSQHKSFILKPMASIFDEALAALSTIGDGIDAYSVNEFFLQSLFLKMTGFQEQKLKCIVWELATIDYTYRYERFSKNPIGECSCFDEKNTIYKDLLTRLSKFGFGISDDNRQKILDQAKREVQNTYFLYRIRNNYPLQYVDFEQYLKEIDKTCIMTEDNLFKNADNCKDSKKDGKFKRCIYGLCLKNVFEVAVYQHRNKCAHNTLSYQSNLPTLDTLHSLQFRYANYFIRFFLLMLIDDIFRFLFDEYMNRCHEYN